MSGRSRMNRGPRFNGGTFEVVPTFSPLLRSIANKMDEPSVEKTPKKRKYNATPEKVVLEVRALYEFGGWSTKRIAEKYGWNYQKVYVMCQYVNMSNLRPTIADLPEWANDE